MKSILVEVSLEQIARVIAEDDDNLTIGDLMDFIQDLYSEVEKRDPLCGVDLLEALRVWINEEWAKR